MLRIIIIHSSVVTGWRRSLLFPVTVLPWDRVSVRVPCPNLPYVSVLGLGLGSGLKLYYRVRVRAGIRVMADYSGLQTFSHAALRPLPSDIISSEVIYP